MLVARRLAAALVATLSVAGLGWLVASIADAVFIDFNGFDDLPVYSLLATTLLAVGLFSCTYGISREDAKGDVRVIFAAVTFGVLGKAALIAGVMYLVFRNPVYIVLAVAVSQIDPLSVAVLRDLTRLSARAKVILSAWSAFDDPVTAILAIYLSVVALNMNDTDMVSIDDFPMLDTTYAWSELPAFGNDLLGNILLVACAALVWFALWWISQRKGLSITDAPGPKARGLQTVGVIFLATIAIIAVRNFLMLGIAVVGLFFRPGIERFISRVTPIAFLLATFVLGLVLADGVNVLPGLVLGGAAFGAQMVVGMLVAPSLPLRDRVRLALGQQSGITAVVLALLLETAFPGTVAVVAPAILVINVLHLVSNTLVDTAEQRRNIRRASHREIATAETPIDDTAIQDMPQLGSDRLAAAESSGLVDVPSAEDVPSELIEPIAESESACCRSTPSRSNPQLFRAHHEYQSADPCCRCQHP